MLDRLHWSRSGDSFVSYPEGERFPHRVARVSPESSIAGAWNWSVTYDQARTGGVAEALQKASESAEVAWPLVKAQAARFGERVEWERRMHALLDKAQAGKIEPEAFPIKAASPEELDWILARAFKRPDSPGLERLIEAISQVRSLRRTR
ncbi:hypothetical protein PRN20_04495 [Devosia sp. ZB163]|uniref:hypothetical protein n=1 Tax=Devosia sp. ZB163 TaxID=3025938 RepID=UPI00235F3197|nr:hypothetical protein [Devosia sp. ZB163]MDC9822981.1 hypothetical protein [Devosia sp. ZB163]